MSELSIWWVIGGMYLITTLLRWVPLCWVQGHDVPPALRRGLRAVPPAIFSALLFYALMIGSRANAASPIDITAYISVGCALAVTIWTRSMVWGALAGLAAAFCGI